MYHIQLFTERIESFSFWFRKGKINIYVILENMEYDFFYVKIWPIESNSFELHEGPRKQLISLVMFSSTNS